jgi:hypothetical protein
MCEIVPDKIRRFASWCLLLGTALGAIHAQSESALTGRVTDPREEAVIDINGLALNSQLFSGILLSAFRQYSSGIQDRQLNLQRGIRT